MTRTSHGLPGIYNSTPLTLSNGDGAALALNASGQIIAAAPTGSSSNQVQGAAADGAAAVGNPVSVGLEYQVAPRTYDDGDIGRAQGDSQMNTKVTQATLLAGEDLTNGVMATTYKPVVSSAYSPTTYKDAGSVTKAVIKAAAGNVLSLRFTNINAAVRYLQLHNKATAPAAAETAQQYYIIPAGTSTAPGVLELGTEHFAPTEYFATGIGWAVSTTATTFTDSATANEHTTLVRYV